MKKEYINKKEKDKEERFLFETVKKLQTIICFLDNLLHSQDDISDINDIDDLEDIDKLKIYPSLLFSKKEFDFFEKYLRLKLSELDTNDLDRKIIEISLNIKKIVVNNEKIENIKRDYDYMAFIDVLGCLLDYFSKLKDIIILFKKVSIESAFDGKLMEIVFQESDVSNIDGPQKSAS
jgi:hypothetical protein